MNRITLSNILVITTLSTAVLPIHIQAQDAEEIIVVGVVPAGTELAIENVPYQVQSASASELQNQSAVSLADFMRQQFSSVSLNDAQNNPLQPDLQYRGFTASPLLGLAQGLAVYQNGVRINEPLGDTVNWDLLPQSAIENVTLIGGTNPLFGLNSLGGSLAIDMKTGFDYQGSEITVSTGSFGRSHASAQAGNTIGQLAWYANIEYFDEDGWRDDSESDAFNFYGSVGWRTDYSQINLNYQLANSELTGNGASPEELIAIDREAIFTGPDITENDLNMISLDYVFEVSPDINFRGNIFYRENNTDSFNGDASELALCEFTGNSLLIESIEDDDLEELGLDDDICEGQFTDSDALEDFLNATAMSLDLDEEFELEIIDEDELSGTGLLADDAINNISKRQQESSGVDFQWSIDGSLMGFNSQLIVGGAWFKGESNFDSVVELAEIDPLSRLTSGLGTGSFLDDEATTVNAETESSSLYFTSALDLNASATLTLSARANNTDVILRDRSGERPELNGSHDFFRINPAIGLTWQFDENRSFYASYSESSRAPTPIELACNEGVFNLAVQYAIEEGEDPDDIEFECRLPNAFLADPPLDDVVAKSIELGTRGSIGGLIYHAGLFHTTNHDDILFQTTGRATGLFANVDRTRRIGFESSLRGSWQNFDWFAAYSFVDATFEDTFKVLSPNHDYADDEGEIQVSRGDQIPGIPQQQFKFSANFRPIENLTIGLDLISNDSQVLRGDESNQLSEVSAYTVVNLRARYQLNEQFEIFARIDNLLDEEYETFGLLGEEPNEVEVPIIEDLSVPRFLGAAPPRAGFIGLRYQF